MGRSTAADGGRLSSPSAQDGEATLVCVAQVGPPEQKGHREMGEGLEEATKVIRCLENMTNKEILGKLGLFHILKRTLGESPIVAQTTASKDDGANSSL